MRWGWKDPRNCLLLPQILELVPEAVFIRTRRNISDIVESMMRAYGSAIGSMERASAIISEREMALDEFLPSDRVLEIDFDTLRQDRAGSVQKISSFLGLTIEPIRQQIAVDFIRHIGEAPPQDLFDVSVIIPTFNEGNWLLRTVLSINDSVSQYSYEIIVVDDSPFEVPLCPGGLMFLKRDWFHKLDGFANNFSKWGCEDIEFSLRHFMRGGSCLVDPRTVVFHDFKNQRRWRRPRSYLSREEKYFNVLVLAWMYFEDVKIDNKAWLERVCEAVGEFVDADMLLGKVKESLTQDPQPGWINRENWTRTGREWIDKFSDQIPLVPK